MAYMIPPFVCEDIPSAGERIIFEKLRDALGTDNWTCLHSLGIAKHIQHVYGEIDFVVLIPKQGIFCLEVKSGKVSRDQGVWEYQNRFGEQFTDPVGPIRQVSTSCFSLINYIRGKFANKPLVNNTLCWWGVVFPQCEFDNIGTECERWQIYNSKDNERPITEFLNNLAKQSHERMKDRVWYDPNQSRPSDEGITTLRNFLRGDFEFGIKKGSESKELEDEILRFTEEQFRCLDSLRDNRPCFFTGAAGTGKTVLSVEFAKREARNGQRVLLSCPNGLLANELNVESCDFPDRVQLLFVRKFQAALFNSMSCSSREIGGLPG